ncbi:ATP-grasp domain-containing protein [Vibrio splendidus]|nr:ATP-grasp domain-containing protein [Vibrio splendidus]MCC4883052.1 ATP-grasp domain-containing protein [Vibrio splendidus]
MINKGIILAIEFKSEANFKTALYIATHEFDDIDESMDHCVARERGKEVLTARKENLPYIAYWRTREDFAILETNFDIDSINKADYRLFERLNTTHATQLGIKPLIDSTISEQLIEWPNMVTSVEVGRKVEVMEQNEFISKRQNNEITLPFFIKSTNKGHYNNTLAMVISDETANQLIETKDRPDLNNGDGVSLHRYLSNDENSVLTIHAPKSSYYNEWIGEDSVIPATHRSVDGRVMVSPVINILSDKVGKLEHRAFILNGRVSSVSRYVDYESVQSPNEVLEHAQAFAGRMKETLPIAYVADFAETDKGIELVEINPYENSGRYLWNCPLALQRDAMALGDKTLTPLIDNSGLYEPMLRAPRKPVLYFDEM